MNQILPTAAVLLSMSLFAVPSAQADEAAEIRAMLDERAIISIADQIDRAVDAQDWPQARSYFADRVTVDFSTLSGRPAETIPADDLIDAWSSNLKGAKTSLHLRTNHHVMVEGDKAVVHSNGYAWNRMEGNGDPLWEVWGTYEHRLARDSAGWKVDGFTFRKTHERGNMWVKATPGQ